MSRHREKGVVRQVLGIVPNVPVGGVSQNGELRNISGSMFNPKAT